ncbi:MAG: hypothetical protein JW874_06265 [Spirochaetales bacterium]|nr:hypothetical protein [Spirochaetales bacterium]
MSFRTHLILCAVSVIVWFVFYLIGMSFHYFIDWSTGEKILIVWITLFAILPLICFFLVVFLGGDYFRTSLWAAFYATVCPFILDTLFVGIFQKNGMGFLVSHWYLTAGYLETLIIMPLTGLALRKFREVTTG